VVIILPVPGVNDPNLLQKQRKFFDITTKHKPVNVGDRWLGNLYTKGVTMEKIYADPRPLPVAVFDNKAAVAAVLKDLKAADLGLCVVASVMTEYLGVEAVSAYRALAKTLETRSPAFHEDITAEATQDSLTYAQGYSIESWGGYLVSLARTHNAPIIYSVDKELRRKVKEVEVVNPLSTEDFAEYNRWLEKD